MGKIKKISFRPSPTALLDPKCDVAFKAMFTQETPESQVARLLNVNTKKGSEWNTKKVYQISVLDFEFLEKDKDALSWYTMKSKNGDQLANRMNVIFFDLIKIHKKFGQPVEKLSKLEKWGLFLAYADDERKADYINEISQSEEGLMNAKTSLNTVSQDEIIWAQQNSIYKARMDYNSNMAANRREGIAEGKAIMIEEFKKLLASGIPADKIIEKLSENS